MLKSRTSFTPLWNSTKTSILVALRLTILLVNRLVFCSPRRYVDDFVGNRHYNAWPWWPCGIWEFLSFWERNANISIPIWHDTSPLCFLLHFFLNNHGRPLIFKESANFWPLKNATFKCRRFRKKRDSKTASVIHKQKLSYGKISDLS